MDFTWVTTDDADAIQNSIVDAKGDLIAASADNTPARLAVGSNGDTLVADSSSSTGLRWQPDFSVGRNKILNSDFSIWQRGTSFNNNGGTYLADRFVATGSGTPATMSQQSFTLGTAPVTGYEGKFYLRWDQSSAATATQTLMHRVESARTFGNQSVTFSFWAKVNSGTPSLTIKSLQNFGTGGSPSSSAVTTLASGVTLTSSWARYSYTFTNPSVAGKTFGTAGNDYLAFYIEFPNSGTWQIDTWGWQAEAGSVATAFQTATGTLQGELAACQRYYWRNSPGVAYGFFSTGNPSNSTTDVRVVIQNPVRMRATPTSVDFSSNLGLQDGATIYSVSAVSLNTDGTNNFTSVINTTSSGLTAQRAYVLLSNNSTSTYIGINAEL
jgi:hypothetical protein